MKINRKIFDVSHNVRFPRLAPNLVGPGSRLLELLLERLGQTYSIQARDVLVQHGALLDDWSLRIWMFNRAGSVSISSEGVQSSFSRLRIDEDLKVIVDVLSKVMDVVSGHSPTLKAASESASGRVNYTVTDGPSARDEYFARVNFPGKSSRHVDVGLKARMRHPEHDVIASLEVEPVWTEPSEILFSFDADISRLEVPEFERRAAIVNELVVQALDSMELDRD